jgi:hypothetical protein
MDVVGVLLLMAAGCSKPAPPTAPAFSPDRFKAHVTFLADDLLEGREAGTRGHEIAARYIAAQFALHGVKPGGTEGGFLERVPLVEARWADPAPTMTISVGSDAQTLTHGDKVVFTAPFVDVTDRISAPLAFVGYGARDPQLGVDDYKGVDVRGKIAVALWGSAKGMDSEIAAHLMSRVQQVAAMQGAIGLLAIPTRATERAFTWALLEEAMSGPRMTWANRDHTPFDPSGGLRFGAFVSPAVAGRLFEGSGTTLDAVLDEADNDGRRPTGRTLKAAVDVRLGVLAKRVASSAVIGVIEGADPRLNHEYVVLMAHSDHIGLKTNGDGDRINNGALDNGAGIATLLEVAHAFREAPPPRRSIMFIAHTAEEKGLLGAAYLARNPTVSIDRIIAGVDLDMPLLLYDFSDVVAYGGTHSTIAMAVKEAATTVHLEVSPDPMPEQAIFVRSDHYELVKAGVPAIMLATGMANGGSAAWSRFMSTHYHQPSDDVSLPILWSAGAKFARLNYEVVRRLADGDTTAWYEGDYFGNLYAPRATKAPAPRSAVESAKTH